MSQLILLNGSTTTIIGNPVFASGPDRTYQATVIGAGAVSATIIIEGSNDNVAYLSLGTITLSGTNSASDGFASNAAWAYVRARITAIAGTGAVVTASLGT